MFKNGRMLGARGNLSNIFDFYGRCKIHCTLALYAYHQHELFIFTDVHAMTLITAVTALEKPL